ncbi:hypothetical protein GCM10011583_05500 [Streptomyces camponoticapitis]|uniref:Uncharacterized protein n=1 Tax=Streptomyces camponoticapitis TaxID=1616125 RepID=A0ABQ2E073_9ACTN|nr:hypothetical protein GCM10011583_05500 [Streptomyces camponoticapitis]
MEDITPVDYDAFRDYVKGKYSENYSKNILGLFKMLMDDAVVKYKLRDESPIVEQRRRGLYKKRQTRRVRKRLPIQAVHQIATNAHTVWGYTGWTYIWTIAFSGARPPGEMYGLQRGYCSPYWPASEPDSVVREEAEKRYEALHAMRIRYQTYVADRKPVLAAPKYDSWRTLVIPPILRETGAAAGLSREAPGVPLGDAQAPTGNQFRPRLLEPPPGRREGVQLRPAVRPVGKARDAGGSRDGRGGHLPAAALGEGQAGRGGRHPASCHRGEDGA